MIRLAVRIPINISDQTEILYGDKSSVPIQGNDALFKKKTKQNKKKKQKTKTKTKQKTIIDNWSIILRATGVDTRFDTIYREKV